MNIDFVTKLPTSEAGHDAVATIIDPLTKRGEWIRIKEADLTVEKFATAFINGYVPSRGLPVSIVSDPDTRFTSGIWQSLCSQLGIRLWMSTAYHPQCDSQAEKANPTLETFLKVYIVQLKSPEQWSRLLPLAEFTYNAAKHKSIGMSPFKADIGYILRLPLDLLAPGPWMPISTSGKKKIASTASGRTRRTRSSGRNLATPDAARQGTVRRDATHQGTVRRDATR